MKEALILIVEDESALLRFLRGSLRRHNYQSIGASTGLEALTLARSHVPDLVLLDLGLPDRDGLDVLSELRTWSQVPVIILSARDREWQKVEALDRGADDYLTKPFGVNELLARMRASLRRIGPQDGQTAMIQTGELQIDMEAREVKRNGIHIKLTPLEYKLLAALAARNGKVATHRQLLSEVWGPGHCEQIQYLHIYIRQLRQKLEGDPTRPRHLQTEPGVGYRLEMQ